jgi:raffinose/stachyose/melibiose transport system substrate-binding protein
MSALTRSRLRRITWATVPLATAALIVSGCSAPTDSNNPGKQQFSLTIGALASTQFEALVSDYKQQNPDVDISVNKLPSDTYSQVLPTQLQAGNAGDLFVTMAGRGDATGVVRLAEAGLLAPLGDKASNLLPEASRSAFQIDGETYGQATSMSFMGTVFNETAAKEVGVSYPTDWNSLKTACMKAADGGKALFALAGSTGVNSGFMAQIIASTRVYAENPKWNEDRAAGKTTFAGSQGWKETLETVVEMTKAKCFQPGAAGAGFDVLTNGLVQGASLGGFVPGDAANQFGAASQGKMAFTARPFAPAESSGKAFGIAEPAYSLSLAKSSKNQAAAQAFLDWMAEPAQSKKFAELQGNLPVSGLNDLDLAGTVYEPVSSIIQNGDFIAQPNSTWPNASVYDALSTGVQGLLTGQKNVDQVLADMDAAWGN